MIFILRSDFVTRKTSKGDYVVHLYWRFEHGHFNTEESISQFLDEICSGFLPKTAYRIESARRILTDKQFSELRPHKRKEKCVKRSRR